MALKREPISETKTLVTTNCRSCAGIFTYRKSQEKTYKGAGQFCSKECSITGTPENCIICGSDFRSYNGTALYCSETCRRNSQVQTPLDRKVRAISANILMGRGKKQIVTKLITDVIGKPCPYCRAELTLENISLDHKVAYDSTDNRRQKAKNVELRKHQDRLENLHMVCRECNSRKSNFNHDEYVILLEFLEANPNIKKKLFKRLAQAKFMWGARREKGKK